MITQKKEIRDRIAYIILYSSASWRKFLVPSGRCILIVSAMRSGPFALGRSGTPTGSLCSRGGFKMMLVFIILVCYLPLTDRRISSSLGTVEVITSDGVGFITGGTCKVVFILGIRNRIDVSWFSHQDSLIISYILSHTGFSQLMMICAF